LPFEFNLQRYNAVENLDTVWGLYKLIVVYP
jgi:hypothetical protein